MSAEDHYKAEAEQLALLYKSALGALARANALIGAQADENDRTVKAVYADGIACGIKLAVQCVKTTDLEGIGDAGQLTAARILASLVALETIVKT